MRIPIDVQRRVFDLHAASAVDHLLAELTARRDELIALARTRAFDTVGVLEYGDSTYHRSPDELTAEADAELADAIFYLHVQLARDAGDL